MTGDQIVAQVLVKLQSESTRQLEGGLTLGDYLKTSLNFCVQDVFSIWPWEWAQQMSAVIPTVNGTMDYTMPANMADIIDIISDTHSIDTPKLDRLPLRTFKVKWAAQLYLPRDKPREYCRLNDTQFRLAPTPNSAYSLTVEGTIRPSTITNFALEVTGIPERYHETLVYGTMSRGAEALKDQGAMQLSATQYQRLAGKMVQDDKKQLDTNYQLQPFMGQGTNYPTEYWSSPFIRGIG
jgi:hypothetical protein